MIINFLIALAIFFGGYLLGRIAEVKKRIQHIENIKQWAEDHGYVERD